MTTNSNVLVCDGCGQSVSAEHIARRLKRLEWTTRYRPVHIHTLFLGTSSPKEDDEFLYSPGDAFAGEAATLLEVAGIARAGKPSDAIHVEYQRRGYFLTHVLECPVEGANGGASGISDLLVKRASAVATRIRRSLKPKRVVLIGTGLKTLAEQWKNGELGCPLLLENGNPFSLDGANPEQAVVRLRAILESPLPAQ